MLLKARRLIFHYWFTCNQGLLREAANLYCFVFQDEDLQKTVEESEKLYTTYSHYFDCVITNDNMDDALKELKQRIEELSTEPQWVPVSWVY